MDSLGNQVINFLDIGYENQAAELVCEFLKEMSESEGRNLAPDKETATYYAALGLYGYALWVNKPGNEKFKEQLNKVVDTGVDLYMQTGHPKRMEIIEGMSKGQCKLKEVLRDKVKIVDEYEIKGQRIDIYLPELQIALEMDGRQHYEFCPAFHKTEADFKRQQWLDREKHRKCRERGITLIRIRYDEEISWTTILSKLKGMA